MILEHMRSNVTPGAARPGGQVTTLQGRPDLDAYQRLFPSIARRIRQRCARLRCMARAL